MLAIKHVVTNLFKCSYQRSIDGTSSSCFSSLTSPLFVRVTPMLMGEPLKKRKKADPMIAKIREDRKRKRLWRDIKRLMKLQNQLKPLDELEVPYSLVDEPEKYARENETITDDLFSDREDLRLEWSLYKLKRHSQDLQMIERIVAAQDKALEELRLVSPTLYGEAVKVDDNFLPFTIHGPTITPPIKNFDSFQGDYIDVTKTWDPPIIPEMEKRLKKQRNEARKAEVEAKKNEDK